jgi:hypothetical protein
MQCFVVCYKLFSPVQHQLRKCGFREWQYIHKTLESHESSSIHTKCKAKWKELELQLKTMLAIRQFFSDVM